MKKASNQWLATLIVALLGLSFADSVPAQQSQGKPEASFHPTRILAKLTDIGTETELASLLQQQGLRIRKRFSLVPGLMVFDADTGQATNRVSAAAIAPAPDTQLANRIAALRDSGLFEYVEPDFIRTINLEPNDERFQDGTLWALKNVGQSNGVPGADIGATTAWDITTGSTNVIVAVVDTGIRYTHQDLAANMWRNPGESGGGKESNGQDDDGDGYIDNVFGIDSTAVTNTVASGNPMDVEGHGTHVAGTIGAAANDGNPHVGVAWNVRLMACKFIAPDGGSVSDEIECFQFALAKGARIINASYGSYLFSQAEFEALETLRDNGVLLVAAAGNNGVNNDSFLSLYPASYDLHNIISVAALDRFDNLAWFSNIGQRKVHLGAPGMEIFSCWTGSDTNYDTFDGTSMATPHVVGAAALVLSQFPTATLTEVRRRILDGTIPIPSLTNITVTGGRLNASDSLVLIPTGNLAIEMSPPSGSPLAAGSPATLSAVISDLLPVTNAAVLTSIAGYTNLNLLDSGSPPDAVAGDGVYAAAFVIPTNLTSLEMTLIVSASGWPTITNLFTYPIVFPPPNDNFANRITIPPDDCLTVVTGSNLNASREAGEPFHVGWPVGRSVWWSWIAPFTGPVKLSTAGSRFDTLLAAYTGQTVSNLTLVAANDDASRRERYSVVKFDALVGTEYQVAVDGYFGSQGDIVLGVLPLISSATLAGAVDVPSLAFTTSANAPWFGQDCVTHDGIDAVRSGPIEANGETWMETTAPGPGLFTFWWEVSSEGFYDYLRFYINGVEQAAISGEVDWQQKGSYWLGTGDTLRWRYSKDRDVTRGQDAGWVDELSFTRVIPAVPSKLGDLDRDGQPTVLDLTLLIGYLQNTNSVLPQVAVFADANGDGFINSNDIAALADAILGRTDLLAAVDSDGDGIPDVLESLLPDGQEDHDLDGLVNARELQLGTDPLRLDSDGDGWPDDAELADGTNPLDAQSGPVIQVTAGVTASYLNALQEMAPSNTVYKVTSLAASYLNGIPEPAPTNAVWTVGSMPVSYLNALLEPPPSNAVWSVASLAVSYLNAIPEPPPTNAVWSVASLPVSYLNALSDPSPTNSLWPVSSSLVSYLNAVQDILSGNLFFVSPIVSYSNSPPGGFSGAATLSPEPQRSSLKNNDRKVYEN